MADRSQKFIARNRAPRVQIEYDVELYGAEKKVQLPFVMGVMSDLMGKSQVAQPAVAERAFLEIDVDNFDARMAAMAPRAAFSVPNTLTGAGNLEVDLTFSSMQDFTPGAVAANVDALRPLLEARQQLQALMTYMDGKAGAEALVEEILANPSVLRALAGAQAGSQAGSQVGAKEDSGDHAAALASLAAAAQPDAAADEKAEATLAALRGAAPEPVQSGDPQAAALDALRAMPEVAEAGDDEAAEALASLAAAAAPEGGRAADSVAATLEGTLADLAAAAPTEPAPAGDGIGDLEAALAGLDLPEPVAAAADVQADVQADIQADILADLSEAAPEEEAAEDAVDDVLAALEDTAGPAPEGDGADDILAAFEGDGAEDDLDGLLAGLDAPEAAETVETEAAAEDDLEALLAGLDGPAEADAEDDEDGAVEADGAETIPEQTHAFGMMSAERPEPKALERKRFRIAILGDFTGRAARGLVEIGDGLAARAAHSLDPDTVEELIEGFATKLVLPIGRDGAGVEVSLDDLDGLHPDELVDNVALFSELKSLSKQLMNGGTQAHAQKTLKAWAAAHGVPARAAAKTSGGNRVPADRRLSDFQALIGDESGALRQAAPLEEALARIVGPHIRALPDPDLGAMQAAVEAVLGDAMRLILHHPEFRSVEAQWRVLDLIARSIEVDDSLEVVLYDVSAIELAADLASHEDLSQSGFVRLLTEAPMDEENGRGAYSAICGLYTFEETPPHAELLGRIARVAAHVDAPFLGAISPAFWDTEVKDLPGLTREAWDTLRAMPEAGHLGLVTPRFMLRRPYGAKSDPIDAFAFEEFTPQAGMRGMLWANPVALVAILMAKSFKANGPALGLGQIMSLGDMPYTFVTDRFGDQVQLPCTDRNVDLDKIQMAGARGFMSLAGVKGRDEVRLASFRSVGGEILLGPWTGMPVPEPSPPDPEPAPAADEDLDLDMDLDLGGDDGEDDFDLDALLGGDDTADGEASDDAGDEDLDALLAGFGDDDDEAAGDDDEMDAELAALLADL